MIVGVEGAPVASKPAPKVIAKPTTTKSTSPVEAPVMAEVIDDTDPLAAALKVALGKTEAQFRTAIAIDPAFAGSPLISLARAGMVTQALVNEGKLVLVKQGSKEVYQLPS